MRGEFGCDRILARFLEQDLKFDSFGNLGLIYTLKSTQPNLNLRWVLHENYFAYKTILENNNV